MKYVIRFLLVTLGAALMALNINTFVNPAGLLPGGFTGLSLLFQELLDSKLNIQIPFTVFYWTLNLFPALICYKYVGKKFTLYSIWMIFVSGLLTDLLPGFNFTNDILLSAIFGGIIQGASICICLFAGATSGGTDFISIYISEKTGRDSWNYIFVGNCLILTIFGLLFGWTRALYAIIFQFASTQVMNSAYKRYQKTTMLIITEKPEEIYKLINETTHHNATLFTGKGCHMGVQRNMIYTVVAGDEQASLIKKIRMVEPGAFINTLHTKNLYGNFFMKKND